MNNTAISKVQELLNGNEDAETMERNLDIWDLVTALRGPDHFRSSNDYATANEVKSLTTGVIRNRVFTSTAGRWGLTITTVKRAKARWNRLPSSQKQQIAAWLQDNSHFWSHAKDGLRLTEPAYLTWLEDELTKAAVD